MTDRKSEAHTKRDNPLRVSDSFRRFVLDQLAAMEDIQPRSMFGGVGLYCRGLFFGIIAGDVLYLKVDETTRGDYERAGMGPFSPYPERGGTMQYYAVPVGVLESAEELARWAKRAVTVAGRTSAKSRTRRG
jgi:DNA transformation protein and related proteins